jgi:hypothetical protein
MKAAMRLAVSMAEGKLALAAAKAESAKAEAANTKIANTKTASSGSER